MPREKKRGDNVASPRSRGADGQQAQDEFTKRSRCNGFAGEGVGKNNATRD